MMKITEEQNKFIWLAFAEKMPYSKIERELSVPRKILTLWTKELEEFWRPISAIRSLYTRKKMKIDFRLFYNWYQKVEQDKKCEYCGITEEKIERLLASKKLETKRIYTRGRKLELDRKEPNKTYDDLENIVYCCYWCNNAKTDTFSHQEFKKVGKVFSEIWNDRLAR